MAPPLTRNTIVSAAFAVLDEAGIDGLTLRTLATRLGVKAPALYWHLSGKQALLDEMGTEVAGRIVRRMESLADDAGFADAVHLYASTMRAEYLRHRDGARTFSGTRLLDPELLRRQETALGRWAEAGIPPEQVTDAFEIVTAFVVGFVIEEQERSQSGPDRYDLERRDAMLGADHPLARASGHRLFGPAEDRFTAHLAVLVPAVTAVRS